MTALDLTDVSEVAEARRNAEEVRARLLNQAHFAPQLEAAPPARDFGPLVGLLLVTASALVSAWFLGRWLSQALPPEQVQGWTVFGVLLIGYCGMFYDVIMRHGHPRSRRP